MFESWNWTWPALALAFCLGGLGTRWLHRRLGFARNNKVNVDYFKGLNFLLNEETDKAIDVFIKALEVDDETVELHLALGGLFRRKGQIDRATRIHQNLIARPNLTEEQRYQAIHELAQDYYKIGWLDRAEGLYDELKGSTTYRTSAINGLCRIYQQEKEWLKAIEILNQHSRAERTQCAKQVAHYYCELTEVALENLDFDAAEKYLSLSSKETKDNSRTTLLQGELAYQQGDYPKAISYWQRLQRSNATAWQLISGKLIESYQKASDESGLEQQLLSIKSVPKRGQDFKVWRDALQQVLGAKEAEQYILQRVQKEGLSGPVANYLYNIVVESTVSNDSMSKLLKELLGKAKSKNIEYTCSACGFDTKSLYWLCQNCGEWESFR